MIDWESAFGRRVNRRLRREAIIWLTTVGPGPRPQPRPVWFLWDGKTILIYSRPDAWKVRHIRRCPNVALNLNSDEEGGSVAVLLGRARIDPKAPPADRNPAYLRKYRQGIRDLGMTPAEMAAEYCLALRVRPTRLRGF